MPFCIVGKHVCIIDLHFEMENITPTSNQFCTNMEDKTLICEKMPLCVVGKFVYFIDLYSGMDNIIPPSNLFSTNFFGKTEV